ncbi:CHAT domain protein [Polystyrenella longa]|uniref:CHAT domain protein n=1 Tax=Polystyrenella longa TaxID=2528007 RepID=A0A518CLN7_9PLAN|nr:CHAT domain-containing tetratricopeptide repeat protein [Polystyrenella longa]QDU80141.1 CHAT domain protein [Polystyrenella longa]
MSLSSPSKNQRSSIYSWCLWLGFSSCCLWCSDCTWAQAVFEPQIILAPSRATDDYAEPRLSYERELPTDFEGLQSQVASLNLSLSQEFPKTDAGSDEVTDWLHIRSLQSDLGRLYLQLGDYESSQQMFEAALTTAQEHSFSKSEEPDQETIACYTALGSMYVERGNYQLALSNLNQALTLSKDLEDSPDDLAGAYNGLGNLFYQMGNYSEAQKYYLQTVAIYRQPESNPESLAPSLHNLALVHERLQESNEAEKLLEESLLLTKNNHSDNSPEYAHVLESMALLLSRKGELQEPETLHQQALAIFERVYRKQHSDYARTLNNSGLHNVRMQKYDLAEEQLEEALVLRTELFGLHHLDTADTQYDLARLYDAQGDYAQSIPYLLEAIDTAQTTAEMASRVQTEQQQLKTNSQFLTYLNHLLSISNRSELDTNSLYQWVLRYKGSVFSRERWMKLSRSHPELRDVFHKLQTATLQLTNLAMTTASRGEESREKQFQILKEEKEALEQQLINHEKSNAATLGQFSYDHWKSNFPENCILVDYFEFLQVAPTGPSLTEPGQQHIAVFVSLKGNKPVLIDLGESVPINKAVNEWRRYLQTTGNHQQERSAAKVVRELVWEPIAKHLSPDMTVLVSPDGSLNRIPFSALPGSAADTYLLEDHLLSILPVAQLLPQILGPPSLDIPDNEPLAMLVVGGVDFENLVTPEQEPETPKPKARRRRRAGGIYHWSDLPATRGEALTIANSFKGVYDDGNLTLLTDGNASEGNVRDKAPGAEYLHFATHAFFAPEELRSAMEMTKGRGGDSSVSEMAYHPGLLSGLVFAGANQPVDQGDDGVLTALDVAELDLRRVELAVLSACETGLGELAGGEGVLGLQRAFQVAGTKTVVSSLWKVDDNQTRRLMERFYDNFWRKEMDMLPAMREAQLWMLREGPRRDFRVRNKQIKEESHPKNSPPYFWAAFVLSGDWR